MSQSRVVYWLQGAPSGHPQEVMRELASSLHFKILGATPQSVADQWWFWIEYETEPDLPEFIDKAEWRPVGSA
jgi:hypothetical protein